jgi:hypothetical protein
MFFRQRAAANATLSYLFGCAGQGPRPRRRQHRVAPGFRAAREAAQGQDYPRPLQHQLLRRAGCDGAAHGFENVRLLCGGFNEWKARGGMDAYAQPSKKS